MPGKQYRFVTTIAEHSEYLECMDLVLGIVCATSGLLWIF